MAIAKLVEGKVLSISLSYLVPLVVGIMSSQKHA